MLEKLKALYPQLTDEEILTYVRFRDDSDGKGVYLAKWEHPTLPRPTAEQLNGVTTGSPSVTTNDSNTVIIFKSSGSYTA